MKFSVQYHPATAHDILKITRWLIEIADHDAAARRIEQILGATRGLSEFPHRGSVRDEVFPGLRVITAAEKTTVVSFRINEETHEVLIVAISFGGGDWMSKSRARLENQN